MGPGHGESPLLATRHLVDAFQRAAHAAARSALDALFTPPDSEPGRLACPLSRRGFLGGKWTGDRPP